MKKDILYTLASQFIIIISVLLSYKISAFLYGKQGFSEYSLIKRNISLISPIILLGLGTSLTRYIALSLNNKSKVNNYFLISFCIVLLVTIILKLLIFIFPNNISFILYGKYEYKKFIYPMLMVLIGLSLHVLIYSYYRGQLFMKKANILQIINLGIAPLVGFLFAKSPEDANLNYGLIMLIITFPIAIKIILKSNIFDSKIYIDSKKLIKYGIQRVPGDFGIMALFSLPVLISTHIFGVTTGGYIAFGIALLNMSGQIATPVGIVMLPKISQLISLKKIQTINKLIKNIFILILVLSLTIWIFYNIFADTILSLYLGNNNEEILHITKIISIGVIAFMLYVALRGPVDAFYKKGINTINIMIGLIVSIISYLLLYYINIINNIDNIIYVFLLGIYTIMFLTIKTLTSISRNYYENSNDM